MILPSNFYSDFDGENFYCPKLVGRLCRPLIDEQKLKCKALCCLYCRRQFTCWTACDSVMSAVYRVGWRRGTPSHWETGHSRFDDIDEEAS